MLSSKLENREKKIAISLKIVDISFKICYNKGII